MANRLTLLDLAKRSGNDASVPLVEAMTQKNALLELLGFKEIDGISLRYKRRVSLPTIVNRAFNEGITEGKSVIENRMVETKIFSARSIVDKLEADTYPSGAGVLRDEEDRSFIYAMGNKYNAVAYTGNGSTNAATFDGIETVLNSTAISTCLAGTGTGTTTGSIIAVAFDNAATTQGVLPGVQGVVTKGQNIRGEDMGAQLVTDSGGSNKYWAYITEFTAMLGLMVTDTRSIGRIANLNSTAPPLVSQLDNLITQMYPYNISAFFMPKAVFTLVQALKNTIYYDADDTELKRRVLTYNGIPLLIDENLAMTETAI